VVGPPGPKWGWRDAALAGQVVVQTVILYLLGSGGYFYQDDFLNMQLAARAPLTPHYLMTPIFVHLEPGVRLEYWLLVHIMGAHYRLALGCVVAMVGLTSWILYLLIRRVCPSLWWAPVLLLLSGLWVGWTTAAPWLASGLEVIPSVLAGACAAYALWRRLEGGGDRWTAATAVAFAAGLAFYEGTMVMIPVLALVVVAAATLCAGESLRASLKARACRAAAPLAWCCFFAVTFVAVDLTHGGGTLGPSPSVEMLISFLGRAWFLSYVPSLFGGPLNWIWIGPRGIGAAPEWEAIGTEVALLIVLVVSVRRGRAQAVAGWALVLVPFILLMGLIGRARAVQFGIDAGQDYRYEANLLVPLVLGVTFVLIGTRRRGRAYSVSGDRRTAAAASAVALTYMLLFVLSALPVSSHWASSGTRSYLTNIRETSLALSSAPPVGGWGVYSTAVPSSILFQQAWPYTQVRTIGLALGLSLPGYRHGREMFVVDSQGRLVRGRLQPEAIASPGCSGEASAISVDFGKSLPAGVWQVALTYTATTAGQVKLAVVLGPGATPSGVVGEARISAREGSVVIPLYWPKPVRRIELLTDPGAPVCFGRVELATAVPTS